MRTLVVLRGIPGSGKSTFIKNKKLTEYTISSDILRVMFSNLELTPSGGTTISSKADKLVWETLFKMLENRMANGEFTVIDAMNIKTNYLREYKKLADLYKYRMYIIDFTDVPLDTCLLNNKMRESYKYVPENIICNMHKSIKTENIPSGYTVLKPEDFNKVFINPLNYDKYSKIVVFGDIHGCYNQLMDYFNNHPFDSSAFYIFVGDYIDRGPESYKVLKFLIDLHNSNNNVTLLEGNHESHIKDYAYGNQYRSKIFENETLPQLIQNGFTQSDAKKFYKSLAQISYFTYFDKTFLVCHGGALIKDGNPVFTSSRQLIKGVGIYEDGEEIAKTWNDMNKNNKNYLIHGHRNISKSPIQVNETVINLENHVEYGGTLRIVEIIKEDLIFIEIKNNNYVEPTTRIPDLDSIPDVVDTLRGNKQFINEKKLNSRISSFNFTHEAFFDKKWSEQTILARGLFIDTENMRVVARSYNKFFNLDERPETAYDVIMNKYKDSKVSAYFKENGFLALISYDPVDDDLFIASKSSINNDFTGYIKNILENYNVCKIKKYLATKNVTMVFECIDVINDKHTIEYDKSKLVLLDIIYNDMHFRKFSYDDVVRIASYLQLPVKQKYDNNNILENLKNINEKYNFLTQRGKPNEGLVLEFEDGFMMKVKTAYYLFWKSCKKIYERFLENTPITGYLASKDLFNKFYDYLQNNDIKNKNFYEIRKDFIDKIGDIYEEKIL